MRLIVAAFLLPLFAESALACSCADWSGKERFSKASAIFVARVSETTRLENPDLRSRYFRPEIVRAKFKLVEALKGNPQLIPYVQSGVARGPDCNLLLLAGFSYLFVLYEDNFVSVCSSVMRQHSPFEEWLGQFRALRDSPK